MDARQKISFTLDPENVRRLKELSDKTRIPQSRLVDEALELLTAYFMLQSLPSSAEFSNGAKEVFARYQEEINNIYENMLLRTAEETGKHFGTMDRGWV